MYGVHNGFVDVKHAIFQSPSDLQMESVAALKMGATKDGPTPPSKQIPPEM